MKVKGRAAVYHCCNRTVLRSYLFGPEEREALSRIIDNVAAFCGVVVLDKNILSNHFHAMLKVFDKARPIDDEELMRRYRRLYKPGRTPASSPEPLVLEGILERGGEDAEKWRRRLIARMNDLSVVMKEILHRFTLWYHRRHGTHGTLWEGRFRSTVVEECPGALRTVAAYIGLNALRAGLCQDPVDYRWCGYAQAMADVGDARAGICQLMGVGPAQWKEALEDYRKVLFGYGYFPKGGRGPSLPREKVLAMLESKGKVTKAELMRCRVRYFVDGGIIGSEDFVKETYANICGEAAAARRKTSPARMRGADWGLHVLRDLRVNLIG